MKRHKLNITEDQEFVGMGITSAAIDYQLCYRINKVLNIDLDKSAIIYCYNAKTKENIAFSGYVFPDKESRICYFIIRNKENTSYLVPKFPTVDYILLLNGLNAETCLDHCKKAFNEISEIQNTFIIEKTLLSHISTENHV